MYSLPTYPVVATCKIIVQYHNQNTGHSYNQDIEHFYHHPLMVPFCINSNTNLPPVSTTSATPGKHKSVTYLNNSITSRMLFYISMPKQFNEHRIVFSKKEAGTTGYPPAKC